jgi:hypothetical protein
MKVALRPSAKQLTVVVLYCAIGQAVSLSPASAASVTASGPSALALAAVVASHGSLLGSFHKRAMSRWFDGKGVFITRMNKITVEADSIICKMSDIDITARSCDLTFKSHKRTLTGRDANEVYATLALASVMSEGAAGPIAEGITNLECTIDPTLIKVKAGGGASCSFETVGAGDEHVPAIGEAPRGRFRIKPIAANSKKTSARNGPGLVTWWNG